METIKSVQDAGVKNSSKKARYSMTLNPEMIRRLKFIAFKRKAKINRTLEAIIAREFLRLERE